MLTCKELTELVTDYLEGRLPLGSNLSFRLHVMMCRNCREYLREMKIIVRTLGALPPDPIPPEISDQLLVVFRNWKSSPRSA